jgi:hypothetical protein
MEDQISRRPARGTVFKDSEERRAAKTKESARLWRALRAATRLTDEARSVGRGVYEISPETMMSVRHHCEGLRHKLEQHERELMEQKGEGDK